MEASFTVCECFHKHLWRDNAIQVSLIKKNFAFHSCQSGPSQNLLWERNTGLGGPFFRSYLLSFLNLSNLAPPPFRFYWIFVRGENFARKNFTRKSKLTQIADKCLALGHLTSHLKLKAQHPNEPRYPREMRQEGRGKKKRLPRKRPSRSRFRLRSLGHLFLNPDLASNNLCGP